MRQPPGPAVHRARTGGRRAASEPARLPIQDRFPDLVAAAAEQLPVGLVLDGELLVWDPEAGALSFEGLQRRAAARSRSAAALAARLPAYYVAFDVLQADGQELLHVPYRDRRARLQDLFANHALTAPWTLCPMTTELTTAREWLESWTDVSGVEGILEPEFLIDRLTGHHELRCNRFSPPVLAFVGPVRRRLRDTPGAPRVRRVPGKCWPGQGSGMCACRWG
ncbi:MULTISPECIES: hypothetical protein [unclassified Streptomyces]|uniref:ATP-dependent DNA ligase n=1 Tax=unclassified Streptomyces TaxID=2593676 RepID=UPI00332725B6